MRKKYFYAAAMAALLASCSSDNLSLTQNSVETEGPGIEGAVNFSAYTPRALSRAGQTGEMNDDLLRRTQANGGGFGVFGYYTDMQEYNAKCSQPNFMYNQGVFWGGAEGTLGSVWAYEPVKYWPNEYGSDAQSADVDKVSFFAYAPYVSVDPATGKPTSGSLTTGITKLTRNTTSGDPMVYYNGQLTPGGVDLCWGVVEPSGVDGQNYIEWATIQDQAKQRMLSGYPWLNVERPEKTAYADQKMKFHFRHALAQLNFQIDADPDITTHDESTEIGTMADGSTVENEGTTKTKVYVRSVTINGIAQNGILNLNNIDKDQPLWLSADGCSNIAGETITVYDGRRDGREGVSEASSEKVRGLNSSIISNTNNTTAGVTKTAVNLFNHTTAAAPIYVIPTGDAITVNIVYDVETEDANLAGKLSDGKTHGSSIENNITKEVTFSITDPVTSTTSKVDYLEAGKKYTVKLHLGLNSVKFDADIEPWDDTSVNDAEAWLPSNVPMGVVLTASDNADDLDAIGGIHLGTTASRTLYAKVSPEEVVDKSVTWASADEQVATVSGGIITAVGVGRTTITATNAETGKSTNLTVIVSKALSECSFANNAGQVVATDGRVYATVSDLNAAMGYDNSVSDAVNDDVTAAAMIAADGLAIALNNYAVDTTPSDDADDLVSYMNWYRIPGTPNSGANQSYESDFTTHSNLGAVTGATWSLPTLTQMQTIFSSGIGATGWHIYGETNETNVIAADAVGRPTYAGEKYLFDQSTAYRVTGDHIGAEEDYFDDGTAWAVPNNNWYGANTNRLVPYGQINKALQVCGGKPMSGRYWLESQYNDRQAWVYSFGTTYFWPHNRTGIHFVRPVLAF